MILHIFIIPSINHSDTKLLYFGETVSWFIRQKYDGVCRRIYVSKTRKIKEKRHRETVPLIYRIQP